MNKPQFSSKLLLGIGLISNLILLSGYGYFFVLIFPLVRFPEGSGYVFLGYIIVTMLFPLAYLSRMWLLIYHESLDRQISPNSRRWMRLFFVLQLISVIVYILCGVSVLENYQVNVLDDGRSYDTINLCLGVFSIVMGLYNGFMAFFGIRVHRRFREGQNQKLMESFD